MVKQILLFFVVLILLGLIYYFIYRLGTIRKKQLELQEKEQKIQQGYTDKIINAEQRLTSIEEKIQQKEQQFNQKYNFEEQAIQARLKDYEDTGRRAIEQELQLKKIQCQEQKNQYEYELTLVQQEVQAEAAALQALKQTRKAAYQALLRQKEMKSKIDDYRLAPSSVELSDIKKLEKVKMELAKPRILSMLIWQTYWQPLAKIKFPIILKDKTKMGIYKITNTETNECYIGQAVDIYKRWNEHCKAGLGIDTPPGNKLYKAIQEYGLQNFTFEILLECNRDELNEKEKYFISLYQADTYGYNGNIGVNKK